VRLQVILIYLMQFRICRQTKNQHFVNRPIASTNVLSERPLLPLEELIREQFGRPPESAMRPPEEASGLASSEQSGGQTRGSAPSVSDKPKMPQGCSLIWRRVQSAAPLFQFGTVSLHPTPDRRVIRLQTALGEQFFDIAQR